MARNRETFIVSEIELFIVNVSDYRHCAETQDRHLEGSKRASTPPYILIADRYYLQITVPISAIYYPIMSYYLHLLRVYIEALELHSQLSCSFNSTTLQSLQLWARIALPADQSIGSHYLLHYLIQEVTTSIIFAVSRASSSTKRTDDRPQSTNVLDRRRTDESNQKFEMSK